jgi:hypothetical protein
MKMGPADSVPAGRPRGHKPCDPVAWLPKHRSRSGAMKAGADNPAQRATAVPGDQPTGREFWLLQSEKLRDDFRRATGREVVSEKELCLWLEGMPEADRERLRDGSKAYAARRLARNTVKIGAGRNQEEKFSDSLDVSD